MWFGVLAGVVATPTIVAEIGKLGKVTIQKGTMALQGWKHGTKAFAISTGVTDVGLAPGLL